MFFYTWRAGLPNLWCSLAKDFVLRSFWHGRDRGLSVFGAFSGLPRTPQKFCSLKPHFKSLSWQLSTALSGRGSILPFGGICGCCWQAQWRLGGSLRILTINLIFALLGSSMLVNDCEVRPWEVQSCFCSMELLPMSCFFIGGSGDFSSHRVILQSSQSFGKT